MKQTPVTGTPEGAEETLIKTPTGRNARPADSLVRQVARTVALAMIRKKFRRMK